MGAGEMDQESRLFPGFYPQSPQGDSQPSITPIPRDWCPLLASAHTACKYMAHRHTGGQNA